ncbi:hypothetical protein Y032_0324g2519 [Ancylostoma ceylanicum]|uniref:Thrombospondin type 1 domain protein n=1 Tax=Ancylostoma ceylanicum TaxID=53326 RepID=A0A016S107_9BILA|nr:hypothetical protein Y032_0324g2519 [Ancylostoma ceylanicum]
MVNVVGVVALRIAQPTAQKTTMRQSDADSSNSSPLPGKYCSGTHAQSRRCNHTKSKLPDSTSGAGANLPEFMWGSWSGWNEWGVCSCPAYQRHRTRYCVGWECSGCGVEYGPCERRCVTERWWSDWSEWINGPSKVRHRSWCSLGVDGRSLVTVLVNDTLPGATAYESTWSEWELRPGVAFRYRLPMNLLHSANDSVDIQHQLIAYNSATQVSLAFCLYLSITTMISGFVAQCLISRMFATCRRTKHRY